MTPTLLAPLGLAALAALAIPLIIHIARRNESRTVQFAAMRWLEARPRPRRRMRFDELWLLAVRLLLLTLLALWLAQPALFGVTDDRPVVAVVPGAVESAAPEIEGARRVWLAPDFPDLASPAPPASANPISLLRELDASLPPEASLTVVAPSILDGVDAERPVLSRAVDWRVAQAPSPAEVDPPEPPRLVVRYDDAHAGGVRYFRAVAMAWTEGGEPAFEPARVRAADHAPLSGAAAYPLPPLELRSWLAVLIALLFALERWMATRPRRSIAA